MITHHVIQEVQDRIKLGQQPIVGKTILHTAPHHDDILLGYFPYLLRNLADNQNHVLYLTSGANGVSDLYLAQNLSMSQKDLKLLDSKTKQELKYNIRESESEKKWKKVAGDTVKIKNLRAKFYESVDEKSFADLAEADINKLVEYLNKVQPDIITVLVDPMGIGPATHYRSQQVLMQAIARYNSSKPIEIIGYRNVWSNFSLEEASMIVPITQYELDEVQSIFQDCFITQSSSMIFCEEDLELKNFAQQVIQIQKNQYKQVAELLDNQQRNAINQYDGMIFLQNIK